MATSTAQCLFLRPYCCLFCFFLNEDWLSDKCLGGQFEFIKIHKKCIALFTGSAMTVQRSNSFTVALFTFVEQCITLSNYFLQTMLQCLIPLELWSLQCNFTPLSKSIQTLRRWFTKHISRQKKAKKKTKEHLHNKAIVKSSMCKDTVR